MSVAPARAPENVVSFASVLEVRILRSIEEIEGVRQIWSEWKTHRDCDIDYCLEHVWRAEGFIRPHVIMVYRQGRADAILVGRILSSDLPFQVGYARLGSARVRLLTFAMGGPLGNASPENAEVLVHSVIDSLRRGEADVAHFHELNTASALYEKAKTIPGFATRDGSVGRAPHYLMEIRGSAEEVYAGLSSGLRAELRRKRRKMMGDFGEKMKIRRVQGLTELDEAIRQTEEVASKTYQRGLGVGFRDTESTRQWLRFCAEHGWLWFYILTIDGQPKAFWIGTLYNGSFCSGDIGFNPELSRYSPGTVLLAQLIDDLCAAKAREIDFGPGDAEYKSRFSNTHVTDASVHIFAPTLRGVTLNLVRSGLAAGSRASVSVLQRTRLLPAVKRLWRKGKTQQAVRASSASSPISG